MVVLVYADSVAWLDYMFGMLGVGFGLVDFVNFVDSVVDFTFDILSICLKYPNSLLAHINLLL